MLFLMLMLHCSVFSKAHATFHDTVGQNALQDAIGSPIDDPVPMEARAHWMRRANQALHDLISPCPFEAFGSVIVNHTSSSDDTVHHNRDHGLGDLICIGANAIASGNPTLHGEIAAITNCSAVLTDPAGRFQLSPAAATAAFRDLTLYTNAEPCAMCAAAIRWAGFRECVFGTSTGGLRALSWPQILVPSEELFRRSALLGPPTRLVQGVLSNETDPYFAWQFDGEGACPEGCKRQGKSGNCKPVNV